MVYTFKVKFLKTQIDSLKSLRAFELLKVMLLTFDFLIKSYYNSFEEDLVNSKVLWSQFLLLNLIDQVLHLVKN